jgi:hypothetical protein
VHKPHEAIPLQGTWIGTASDHLAMKVAVKVTMAADARAGQCPTSSGLRLGQRSVEHPGAQGTAGEDLAEMQFQF